ncbi:glyoxalase [Metakosakonia massiliensis]|uniref:Glyoxalase-like domain protein n=1 Tax=Phytobacter massiliensis TaxID=1485952 RepID=A0A6N3EXB6_9ENTR
MTTDLNEIDVLFVAGFGPVMRDTAISKAFYKDTLRLPLKHMEGNSDYMMTDVDVLAGVKHFALWPLSQAAQSCFATEEWPEDIPVPQGWVEFEVQDIEKATEILIKKGYQLLIDKRLEPWGQTVTRLLSPEGLLTGVTITPWLRSDAS